MYQKRTDLALEIRELHGEESGIDVSEDIKDGIKITTAVINSEKGEQLTGKSAGKYITVDIGKIWNREKTHFNRVANILAGEIGSLIPVGEGSVLVAGLGNEEITPDSLGPRTVKKMLVTRHISSIDPELYKTVGFASVAAISPGVLGQTGIESAEIIKSIAHNINPKCVILIDALASRRLERLATTVQISDTGISPGAGVGNRRCELNEKNLGAPVVSVGVPTVVDAATLAYDILEEHVGAEDECFSAVVEKILAGGGSHMFVTPKDNDIIARETSELLAMAINLALHKMDISEINDYVG